MQIQKSMTINADSDSVWDIVAHQFDRVGEWSTAVASSSPNPNAVAPDGAMVGGRVCDVPGFGDIKETFTAYSEKNKQYTFAVDGMPSFITLAQNTVTVRPISASKSEVSLKIEMQTNAIGKVMGPMFRIKLSSTVDGFLADLKVYAETGSISPKKRKQLAKAA